uniref:RRM domain-containing protein n=1 Tax=Globisporangium ultimum (strain ATCC 200006 / CBS 805.95 / DAOM BR144) TaxID=431595 RepID=K3X9X9_GLOUD
MARDEDADGRSKSRKRRRRDAGERSDARGQPADTVGRRFRSRSRSPPDERRARPSAVDRHRTAERHPSSQYHARLSQPHHWFATHYDPIQIGSIDGTDTTPHDKALVRAMRSRFDATRDPKIQGDPYVTLFVGRLNYETAEDTLREYFAQYGELRRVVLVRDIATQRSKGYAFVEFAHEKAFVRAYHDAHRRELDGRAILVDYERGRVMPGWKPRRVGGGLGGKKESGQLRFGGRDHPFKPPAM